jgi:hypothetical protein
MQDIPLPSTISNGNPALVPYDPTASYPAAVAGLQTQKRTSNNYAGKLTWYATPNHRLEFTAFGDPSTGDMGVQRIPTQANGGSALRNIDFAAGGGLSSISYGGNNYSLKYDAVFTPTFFMQAQIGRHDGKFEETSDLNASRYTDQRQLQGQCRTVVVRWRRVHFESERRQRSSQGVDDVGRREQRVEGRLRLRQDPLHGRSGLHRS